MPSALGLEADVQDLRDEVEDLKSEVLRLRRMVGELKRLVEGQSNGSGSVSRERESGDQSWRRVGPTSGGYSTSPECVLDNLWLLHRNQCPWIRNQHGNQRLWVWQNGPSAHTSLTWLQREAICDQIGQFLAHSISGNHRGTSGRAKINLASRLWDHCV